MKLRKCRELNAMNVEKLLKKKLELKIRSRDYRGVVQGFCLYSPALHWCCWAATSKQSCSEAFIIWRNTEKEKEESATAAWCISHLALHLKLFLDFFNMDFCENEFRSLIPKLKNVTSQETLLFSPRNTLTAHQGAAPHTSNPWFRNLKIS